MAPKTVNKHIETFVRLMSPSCLHHSLCVSGLYVNPGESRRAIGCWRFSMLECIPIHSWNSYVSGFKYSIHGLVSSHLAIVLTFIYGISVPELHVNLSEAFDCAREIFFTVDSNMLALERLLWDTAYL